LSRNFCALPKRSALFSQMHGMSVALSGKKQKAKGAL
jgi:hypothetical protein